MCFLNVKPCMRVYIPLYNYVDSIYYSATGCKKQVLSFRTVVKLLSNFIYLLLGKQLYTTSSC